MIQGAGSPLLPVSATTPPVPGRVFLFSGSGQISDTDPSRPINDTIDLSDGAQAKLEETRQALLTISEGRGELAEDELKLAREQLQHINDQLGIMAGLAAEGDPHTREIALEGLAQIQNSLKNIGNRLGLMETAAAGQAEIAGQFHSVVKGFRQQLKELDEMFRDENRTPPGLLRMLREMTSFPRSKEDAVSTLA